MDLKQLDGRQLKITSEPGEVESSGAHAMRKISKCATNQDRH